MTRQNALSAAHIGAADAGDRWTLDGSLVGAMQGCQRITWLVGPPLFSMPYPNHGDTRG
jgi:hypothetical protein